VTAGIVALADAIAADQFGAKASNLARALRAGLPVPDGLVLAPDAARSPARVWLGAVAA
jgi:hypothetical protein